MTNNIFDDFLYPGAYEIESMNDDLEKERRVQPVEGDTITLNLGTEENKKEIKIGAELTEEEKMSFEKLLKEFVDVFAGHMLICQV